MRGHMFFFKAKCLCVTSLAFVWFWLLCSMVHCLSSGCLPVFKGSLGWRGDVLNIVPGSHYCLLIKILRDGEYLLFCSFTHEDSFFHSINPSLQYIIVSWMTHFTAREPQKLSPSNGGSRQLRCLLGWMGENKLQSCLSWYATIFTPRNHFI